MVTQKGSSTDKVSISKLKSMMYNLDIPDEEIRQYLKVDEERSDALAPVISIDENRVETDGKEAAVAVGFLNSLARWRRQMRYRRKVKDGFQGIKIVSEGDSWFQYPWLLDDVIDHLFNDYAIFSLGAAGDELGDILIKDEFTPAIRTENPELFLISGGGNDLFGGGRLAQMLNTRAERPEDYPNERFNQFLTMLTESYRRLFSQLTREFPRLSILCHGYDFAIPNKDRWLGEPMEKVGITDPELQKKIIRVIVKRFSAAMADAADDFPNAYFVDCRDAVKDNRWHDELHPTNEGYKAVADRFRTVISAIISSGRRGLVSVERLSPGRERQLKDAQDLSASTFQRLVARRARTLDIDDSGVIDSEERRREVESEISQFFEKLNLGADFLPARFLRDGARQARSVCRIRTPGELGTGFLIASRGFIMTNHHVLPSADVARTSIAEFGFEDGTDVTQVALLPDRLFISDEGLDFTIVACDDRTLSSDVEPVALLRNPATVTRGEAVNIIQHPSGRPKEIAIHNNHVKRVLDRVVHYRTDTEPGSSGSPVFNNQWQLVALHHAGWSEAGGRATNEGIRIAAIVSHLLGRRRSGTEAASALNEILSLIPDSSPYLGFFDIEGVEGDGAEVEVPDFQGDPDFADVGFWNIENFNTSVEEERVERTADVIDRLSMDVMGLVEVEKPALKRLVQALRHRGNNVDFKVLDVPGRQDLAVLFDQDTATVELAPDIADRNRQHINVATAGGKSAFPRASLFARCRVAADNTNSFEFVLVLVHLKAFGDTISRRRRRLAAQSLSNIIEDIRSTERLPVILGGDFNESLNNDILSALTNSPDLFALTSDDALAGAASFVGGTHHSLIDHIIVSRDVRPGIIQGDDAAIVRLDRRIRDFSDDISDHVPVVMRIVMRSTPIDITQPSEPGISAVVTCEVGCGHAQVDIPKGVHTMTMRFKS